MTVAQLFSRVATLAMELDLVTDPGPPMVTGPEAIRAVIYDTAGGWPGGGSGEPVTGGGMSDPTSTAAIRAITSTARDDTADLVNLEHAVAKFVTAVGAISHKCKGDRPDTWPEAVKDCHLLDSAGMIQAAADVGVDLFRDVDRAHDAVTTIRRIHDGHCPHIPDDGAKLMTGDPICLSHARIGDYDRPRYGRLHVCQHCYDMMESVCRPAENHSDSEWWPSVEMLRAHADKERTGKRADYNRERALWVERKTKQRWSA